VTIDVRAGSELAILSKLSQAQAGIVRAYQPFPHGLHLPGRCFCALNHLPYLPLTPITCEPTIVIFTPSGLMSHANPATSSSPNFQLIFNNALEAYKKRTKNDLLTHPLVVQLQNCTSSSAVLALIHQQVQGFQRDDDRLTKWLDPTVRVLHVFSETLGEGVSLVCLRK
jgi:hypothetical protein